MTSFRSASRESETGKVSSKSYTFAARTSSTGTYFLGGFYKFSAADANLTNLSLTVILGSVNHPYAAHAFIVSGGNGTTDGSDLVLTVTGTSITDSGTRTTGDSEVIEATAGDSALNSYFETTKKWIGQVTFTLSSTGGTTYSYDFNYGFAKYDDLYNNNFTIEDFELVGLANVSDSGFNVELLYHNSTGWTYSAAAFVAGNTPLVDINATHGAEKDLIAGEQFAFKDVGLSAHVIGSNGEGYLIRITQGANNSISYLNVHVGSILEV